MVKIEGNVLFFISTITGPVAGSSPTGDEALLRSPIPSFKLGYLTAIDQIHKSHYAPVPYSTMHYSEQTCSHYFSEWCIVGYGTGAPHCGITEIGLFVKLR